MTKIRSLICAMVMLALPVLILPQSVHALPVDHANILNGVNELRTDASLPVLKENTLLDKAALAKASDMCKDNYFEHADAQGRRLTYWIPQAGYSYNSAGENLARGYTTAEDTVRAWANSPGHYKNIVDTRFSETGIGIVSCPSFLGEQNVNIVVQHFGEPLSVPVAAVKPAKVQVEKQDHISVLLLCLMFALATSVAYGYTRRR